MEGPRRSRTLEPFFSRGGETVSLRSGAGTKNLQCAVVCWASGPSTSGPARTWGGGWLDGTGSS